MRQTIKLIVFWTLNNFCNQGCALIHNISNYYVTGTYDLLGLQFASKCIRCGK